MKKTFTTLVLIFSFTTYVNAQFATRYLKEKQSQESFVKLVYHTMNDSIVSGYGFPDPTSISRIVFTENYPTEEKTKDWKTVKPKYVEFYYNKLAMNTRIVKIKYSEKKSFLKDTLRAFYLKGKGGGRKNGLEAISYENESVRLFEPVKWAGINNYAYPVFFQTKGNEPIKSKTSFINFNSSKAFIRSSKRVFKKCKPLLEKINGGDYYPKTRNNLKLLADDYELLCIKEN